jgi:hypothetical protein
VDLKVLGNEGVGWINLVQGKATFLASVYAVMNLGFCKEPIILEHAKQLSVHQE